MLPSSPSPSPRFMPATQLQAEHFLRSIDLARLKALESLPPVAPQQPVIDQAVCRIEVPECHRLVVWEQQAPEQQLYVQPTDRYNVFVRLCGGSMGVVQWRQGQLDVRSNAQGEVVVVPPFSASYFRSFEPSRNLHISFESTLLAEAARSSDIGTRLSNSFGLRDNIISQMASLMLEYMKLPHQPTREFVENLCLSMGVRLLERLGEREHLIRGRLTERQLRKVHEYMEAHVDGSARLSEMAALLGMGACHFLRSFKATLGTPPMRHALNLRMRRARHLIETTRKPLIEIAFDLGFDDSSHFSRTFRKHFGCSPSELRGPKSAR